MGPRGRRDPRGCGSTRRSASKDIPLRRACWLAWNLQLGRAGISMKLDGSRMPNRSSQSAFRGAPHDGCAVRLADGLTILALLKKAVRRAIRALEERRDQIQDDIPEAVAQDDAPKIPRLEDDESVEQSDREHEHEVDPVQEEDVKGCEHRGPAAATVAHRRPPRPKRGAGH